MPGPKCKKCNSGTRFRKIAHILTKYVFQKSVPLFQVEDNQMRGIGLSDAYPYANSLARFPYYTNTFYHKEPYLDIKYPSNNIFSLDYLISSDVFEHTPPPADIPFIHTFNMLKYGGKLVLSLPVGKAVEHFPKLYNYKLFVKDKDFYLYNVCKDGSVERHYNLRFHGGPGSTVEMRVFSIEQVENFLKNCLFSSIEQIDEEVPKYGITNLPNFQTFWIATK